MRIIGFKNPFAFIVHGPNWSQYYIKGKMLQIDKNGKTLIDTTQLKEIRKVWQNVKDIFKK